MLEIFIPVIAILGGGLFIFWKAYFKGKNVSKQELINEGINDVKANSKIISDNSTASADALRDKLRKFARPE